MDTKRIVILGGGFGGVKCAQDLSRHMYKDAEIVLVDKNGYHEYHPNYYRIATTFLPESRLSRPETFEELRGDVSIELAHIIDTEKIRLVQDEVTDIKPQEKRIIFRSGDELSYDWLVLALGSVSNFFEIPGAYEYSVELKSASDALEIRNRIDEVFSSTPKHHVIDIIIAGGGLSGCEMAASLSLYMKRLSHIHPHPANHIRIFIIEAGDTILRDIRPVVRKRAEKRLEQLGVRILLRSRITKVTSKEIHGVEIVSSEDHPLHKRSSNEPTEPFILPYSVFLWTAGVKAHHLADVIIGAERNAKSCLIVDEYLRVLPFENIFAIGDMAACVSASSGKPLPMTAQVAISEGRYVAYMLKRIFHKRMTFRYYKKKSRFIIPLGGQYAIADMGWFIIEGRLGWWLKRLITLDYLTNIMSFGKAYHRWRTSHKEG